MPYSKPLWLYRSLALNSDFSQDLTELRRILKEKTGSDGAITKDVSKAISRKQWYRNFREYFRDEYGLSIGDLNILLSGSYLKAKSPAVYKRKNTIVINITEHITRSSFENLFSRVKILMDELDMSKDITVKNPEFWLKVYFLRSTENRYKWWYIHEKLMNDSDFPEGISTANELKRAYERYMSST